MLNLNTVVRPSPDVLFQSLDGEAVLLDLASESYFGLDSVGTRVWQLLENATCLKDVRDQLITEYEVDSTRMESDLIALINRLVEAGLVQLHPA